MKRSGERPPRSMLTALPRQPATARPGIRPMDADLGHLAASRPPVNLVRTPPPPKAAPAPLSAKEKKLALSRGTSKGYLRGPPKAAVGTGKAAQIVAPENTDPRPVSFPIDLVYTWVDGSDEEWLKIRRRYQPTQKNIPEDSLLDCRWRDFDELRLSVESALRFAPWLRTIFILSDFQRPHWFDEANPGKVKFIDHPDLFQELEEHLPTFNSHALEVHLHRIPGLAEHFIYANDDTFFGQDVYPLDFFTADGKFKVFLTVTDMETERSLREYAQQAPPKPILAAPNSKLNPKWKHTVAPPPLEKLDILPYFTAQAVTNAVLDQVFGPSPAPRKRLKHQMKALRRSTFEWCWEQELMQLYLFNTSSTRFRSLGDIDATSLVSHAALWLGEAVPASISSKYYGVEDHTDLEQLFSHMATFRPSPKLYCVNDNLSRPTPEVLQTLRQGLEQYMPHKQ